MSDLCTVCGGPFSIQRVWIDGKQYHQRCAVMSYPPHTHADYVALSDEIASLREQLADFQRTAWLILRSCTFDGGYVAVERSTVAEFDPGKSILESWTDVKDGAYCFRARVALTDEKGKP